MPVPLALDRVLVAAAVALTAIVFLTDTADPVNIPKLAVLLLLALALPAVAAVRGIRTRRLVLPWGLPALAALLLAGAFTLSALVAPQLHTALLGATGRNSGLYAYLAALTLYLSVLRAGGPAGTRAVAFGLLAGGTFTAAYGLLQFLGVDAIAWSNPFNPIIATLGNPDFASAYLGITAPVAVWGALWTGWAPVLRALSGAVALLALVVAALSSAVQGPIAAAAGLAVVALALTLDLSPSRRRLALAALGGAAALGVGVLGLGAAGAGPARPFFTGISYDARTWYWTAALRMWQRRPLTGIGLDSYGLYWRRDRPLANPRTVGGDAYSDSAHSVPLQHLAEGGLLLAAAYLLFVAVVLVALVRGLHRLAGQERLLLGGLGGAWAAYQVQSLVSIDQVPLLVVNFVLGAAVVVAAGAARTREVTLPGALPAAAPPPAAQRARPAKRGRSAARGRPPARGRGPVPRRRPVTAADAALLGAVGTATAVAMWLSLTPLRANLAAHDGDLALSRGDGTAALADFTRAIDLEPRFGPYRTRLAQTYNLGKRQQQALDAFETAWRVDHAEIGALRTAGRLAESLQQYDRARRLYAEALAVDPINSATVLDWATFQLRHGSAAAARERLNRAVADLPGDAGLWAALGDARGVFKDTAGARAAYQRALALDPQNATATTGLAKLPA